MKAPVIRMLPAHVKGLLRFLSKPSEKSNEDLAIGYFRNLYPDTFVRQAGANGADGYVPGYFVLELKGRTGDWFAGLCQGIAYKRELDFSTIVVAAKDFLAVWRLEDVPERMRAEILSAEGAASSLGQRFARSYKAQKGNLQMKAIWNGHQIFLELFASQPDLVLSELRSFEQTLRQAKKIRRRITPRNFTTVLKEMTQYFDSSQPLKAVNAFYSMVYAWNEHSVLQISKRSPNQAALGGELITDLLPGKRTLFKEFVESQAVRLGPSEHIDDFFSRYDEALDAVDKDFRIRHGIFFTDLDLSKFALWLVKQHVPNLGKNYIVIDPACGSGNLVTNWRSPLDLRHKVVSEIAPDLLYVVEQRMKGDHWHNGKFTVVPKTSEGRGLNFLDSSAADYLSELTRYLLAKGLRPDKPLAFLCNPPYRSDDDQTTAPADYPIHPSIVDVVGRDASAERYCCFLAQMSLICKEAMDSGLPGEPLLLVFTKAAWLTERTMFRELRHAMLSQFSECGGFLVNSKQFFDVKGKFPVAFTVWRYVGENHELDGERPICIADLTGLTKQGLASLPWDRPDLLDERCRDILERAPRVFLGLQRQTLKQWVGQSMTDFKRSRRQAEQGLLNAGGLPRGDARLRNKKVYGDQLGRTIGFLDDLTPCRIGKIAAPVPHFHLDPRFMRIRDSRCLSGHSDHYSYQASNVDQAKRLFFWYALGRTFVDHGYPMWADASEIWAPRTGYQPDDLVLAYALAIGFAENDCVETIFPANNPVPDAPEISCTNPLAPNVSTSFWCKYLEDAARRGNVRTATHLIDVVKLLYGLWKNKFDSQSELFVPYKRAYFIDDGVLRQTAGIVQIRDYTTETNDAELAKAFQVIRDQLKKAKQEFYDLIVDMNRLNYFGQTSSMHAVRQRRQGHETQFDQVLVRRLTLAGAMVHELTTDRHFGRTKMAKVFYLAEMSQDLDLQTNYYREAAGPLDARALYNEKIGIEALGAKRDLFVSKSDGRGVKYLAGPKLPMLLQRAATVFGRRWEGVNRVIDVCRSLSTEQCEIIATLFACWNDLLLEGKHVNDELIMSEFLTKWHEKKRRFSRTRLIRALAWMRGQELVPEGRGKHTLKRIE